MHPTNNPRQAALGSCASQPAPAPAVAVKTRKAALYLVLAALATVLPAQAATPFKMRVPISPTAVMPGRVVPSLTDVVFTGTSVGYPATPVIVALSNPGGTAAAITGAPGLSGADAGLFSVAGNTCGSSLASGATCAVTIGYTPTAAGTFNATLSLTAAGEDISISVTATADLAFRAEQLAPGFEHTLAIRSDGSLWVVGRNQYGQLGKGATGTNLSYAKITALANVKAVAAGYGHSLALLADGTLWAAGRNDYGQLGTGDNANRNVFVQVLDQVTAISAGSGHSLAIRVNGEVWGTGLNTSGQLGIGDEVNRNVFTRLLNEADSIAAGGDFSVIILNGQLFGAGGLYNVRYGEWVSATRMWNPIPEASGLALITDAQAVAAGQSHTVLLRTDGSVWTTGENGLGALGTGNTVDRGRFVKVFPDSVVGIAAGNDQSAVLKADGSVWTTGYDGYGGQGNGTSAGTRSSFGQVFTGAASVHTAATGLNHHVRMPDGRIWGTGHNGSYQLGLGNNTHQQSFMRVP